MGELQRVGQIRTAICGSKVLLDPATRVSPQGFQAMFRLQEQSWGIATGNMGGTCKA